MSNASQILLLDNSNRQKGMRNKRVLLTKLQYLQLEDAFEENRYLTKGRREKLAASLCISEKRVSRWFEARRSKETKNQELFLSRHNGNNRLSNVQKTRSNIASGLCF